MTATDAMVRSYDGYRLDTPTVETQNDDCDDSKTFNQMLTGSENQAQCMHCAKPLIFDMSARIQAKQDYIEMLEAEKPDSRKNWIDD